MVIEFISNSSEIVQVCNELATEESKTRSTSKKGFAAKYNQYAINEQQNGNSIVQRHDIV